MTQKIIIAIDGPSASGKGTLARRLAEKFCLFYMDTGALYRCVAKRILDEGKNPDNPDAAAEAASYIRDHLTFAMLEDPSLRNDIIADATSRSSKIPEVRRILLDIQRRTATHPLQKEKQLPWNGSILDGRDIGTVVCPDADIKLYVTASAETRAKRRFKELSDKGIKTSYETVLKEMTERDSRDSSRETSPLKPAEDAIIFDTSSLNAEQAFEKAYELIKEKMG